MRQKLFGSKRRKITSVAILLVLIGAVSALAVGLWTTTQPGSAVAKGADLSTQVTVTAATTPIANLYPSGGSNPAPIYIKVTNSSTTALVLTAANLTGTQTACTAPNTPAGCLVTSANQAGCPSSSVGFNGVPSLSIAIPVGVTDNIPIPGAVYMQSAAPSACQGNVFTIASSLANAYGFVFNTP